MSSQQKEIPIIYWSKWFDLDQWEGYTIDNCNLGYTCKMTHNRSRVTNDSVLIFHASDVNKKNFVFPEQLKNSAWVYHDAEAPNFQSPDVINRMQYSMTYRLDSISLGDIYKKKNYEKLWKHRKYNVLLLVKQKHR
ncbi:unnamed protein product [Mucor hiemalis]